MMTYFPNAKQLGKFHLKLESIFIHFVSNERAFKKSFDKRASQVAP